jgi:hypothetical protein
MVIGPPPETGPRAARAEALIGDFRDAVKRAEREAEIRAVAIIQNHMARSWQAAMTYLERKFPGRWGRRMDVTTGGQPVGTIRVVTRDPTTGEDVDFEVPPPTLRRPPEK